VLLWLEPERRIVMRDRFIDRSRWTGTPRT